MLRRVYLYGKLRKKCGVEYIDLAGNSVAELVRGVSANFGKQLKPTMESPKLACRVRNFDYEVDIVRQLRDDETEIHLYPTLIGSGGNMGLLKIALGVILLVTFAILTGGAGLAALAAGTAHLTMFGSVLLSMGAGLVLGGLMELIMPQPRASSAAEASKYLGATGNTVRIGTTVPIIVGRHKAFGHWISFNVDAFDSAGGGGGGGGDTNDGTVGGQYTYVLFDTDPPAKPKNLQALWLDPDAATNYQPYAWTDTGSGYGWHATGTYDGSEHAFVDVYRVGGGGTRMYVQAQDLPNTIGGGAQSGYISINTVAKTTKVYISDTYGWVSVESLNVNGSGSGGGGTVGDINTRVIFSKAIPGAPVNPKAAWLDPDDTTHPFQPHNYTTTWTADGDWDGSGHLFANYNFEGGGDIRVYVQAADLPSDSTGLADRYLSINTTTKVARQYNGGTWNVIGSINLDDDGDSSGVTGTSTTVAILANDPPGQPVNDKALWLDKDSATHPYQPYEFNDGHWFVPAGTAFDGSGSCWVYTPKGASGTNRLYILTVNNPTIGDAAQGFLCVNTTTNTVRMYVSSTATWNLVESVNV